MNRAVEVRRNGDLKSAVRMLEEITAKNSNYYRAFYNLGLAYTDSGATEKGLESLLRAHELRKANKINDPTLDNSIGWSYLLLGNYNEAERYFDIAIANSASMSSFSKARLYNNYAQVKIYKKDYVAARKYLNLAIENGSTIARKTLRQISNYR